MKIIACVISLLTCICSFAQVQPLESKVYIVDSYGHSLQRQWQHQEDLQRFGCGARNT
jgi:hypothetical protein